MKAKEIDPQVIAEFRRQRTRQLIVVVPFVGALMPLLMLDNAGPDDLFGIPSVVAGSVCGKEHCLSICNFEAPLVGLPWHRKEVQM